MCQVPIRVLLVVLSAAVVDITTYHRGFHGDLNETMFVGAVSDRAKLLVQTTHECLARAIAAGNHLIIRLFY